MGNEQAEQIVLQAKQYRSRIAISQWVLNECIAAVERKKKEGKMNDREASEVLTGIADIMEGQLEETEFSLYPVSENVVIDSRRTMTQTHCVYASDALHLYTADKANCDYFVTADHILYSTLANSVLKTKLVPINISNTSEMSRLLSA
jgi:predicted nucleic acid-binding protein